MSQHIVIDAREYASGSGRYIRKLLHHLEKIDQVHQYTVLLHPKDINAYQPTAANFSKREVPFQKFSLGEQIGFASFLRRLKPDLVHFTFANQPVLYRRSKVTAVLDLTAARFNLAFGINRLVSPVRQRIYKWVVKSAVKKSRKVITISDFVKNDLVKTFHVSPSKITTTSNAADLIPDKAVPLNELKGVEYIMYVGRVQAHKNVDRLVDALALLQTTRPNLKLVIVGQKDVAYQALGKHIQRSKIDGVITTGFVSDAELKWLYQNCAAYVFPSLSEGFGLPGLEAMVHGAPVVSSNATCLPEIYEDAALYFNPENIEDMAQKIERVIEDKPFRQELIKRGHTQAAKYSWRRMAEQTLGVYRTVLGPQDK